MSIACYALHIRHPRAHILPSLTDTCQLYTVSLKAGLSTYNRFARGALHPPDGETTQPNTGIVGVARQAATCAAAGLMEELKTRREEEGEDKLDTRLGVVKELAVGRFVVEIDGDGAVCAGRFDGLSHVSSP